MNREYIPDGMLEKQYNYEIVNHQLYYYMAEMNQLEPLLEIDRG